MFPTTPNSYACQYCSKVLLTEAGRRSHVQQTRACRNLMMDANHTRTLARRSTIRLRGDENLIPDLDVEMIDLLDDKFLGSEPHSGRLDVCHDETQFFSFDTMGSSVASVHSAPSTSLNQRQVGTTEVEDPDVPRCSSTSSDGSESDSDPAGAEAEYEFIEDFPGDAGTPGNMKLTAFEEKRRTQEGLWYPFDGQGEWELARWLMTSGVSQNKRESFLKLPILRTFQQMRQIISEFSFQTRDLTNPSFHNNRLLLKKIDALLEVPRWTCKIFEITGDLIDTRDNGGEILKTRMLKEEVELWRRDPVECVRELIGNPTFQAQMRYAPEKVYTSEQREDRKFDNMWTSEWWWETQVRAYLCF
jgi:hypothetical protein